MNRSEFLRNSCTWLGVTAAGLKLTSTATGAETVAAPIEDATKKALTQQQSENQFINHWLTDLFDTIEVELDRPTQLKLIEGCGRGCFQRHEFKRAIARQGDGDLEKLVDAYRKNFEIWRDGDVVHIRYGETSPGCYCPAARNRPAKPNDIHCECTRMTHQTIFETALHRPFKVEILESIRRGGKTCHLLVHLAPIPAA